MELSTQTNRLIEALDKVRDLREEALALGRKQPHINNSIMKCAQGFNDAELVLIAELGRSTFADSKR